MTPSTKEPLFSSKTTKLITNQKFSQFQNATKLRLKGLESMKWKRRKAWQKIMTKWKEYLEKMELWRSSLNKIEGNFGTGVVAYFLFLRWLMFLNLLVFMIIFVFIIFPQLILVEPKDVPCDLMAAPTIQYITTGNVTNETVIYPNTTTQCCTEYYLNETKSMQNDFSILHIVQGTGFMEKTLMFYGMYTNQIYGYDPNGDTDGSINVSNNNNIQNNISSFNISKRITSEEVLTDHDFNVNYTSDEPISLSNGNASILSMMLLWSISGSGAPPSTSTAITNLMFDDNSSDSGAGSNTTSNNTDYWWHKKVDMYYDLPLAYIIVTILCYLYTLVAIVKQVAHEFKDRMIEGEGQYYQYCNLIFCGWDFSLHNQKAAHIKYKAIYNEIKGLLHTKRFEDERNKRTPDVMFKLIMIRFIINLLVAIILIVCAVVIYVLFNWSLSYLEPNFNTITRYRNFNVFMNKIKKFSMGGAEEPEPLELNLAGTETKLIDVDTQFEILFFEFIPYIAIVCFNLLVPVLFNYLITFEQYSPLFVVKMNLFRTVGLRLSSLAVLISRFYYLVSQKNENSNKECFNVSYGTPQCWETFVGQQFYKLFIVDFVTHIFVTFFVNFPRSIIARNMDNKFSRFIEIDFELSKHVLDIVYSQTICWLGSFFAPVLPAIAAVLLFFMFYIKKFACLVNSRPSEILYRASKSNSLFMIVLLMSFTIAIIPVVYAIAEIVPSRSCGPFRGLESVWDRAISAFMKLPNFLRTVIFFFGTSSFAVPCFFVLTLFLYYYYSVSNANKHMVQVLKNQLILEGHDKQFLLSRLSLFIKQQQEYQKRIQRQFCDQNSTTTNSVQSNSQPLSQTQPSQQPPTLPPKSSRNNSDRSVEIKQQHRMSEIGDI